MSEQARERLAEIRAVAERFLASGEVAYWPAYTFAQVILDLLALVESLTLERDEALAAGTETP